MEELQEKLKTMKISKKLKKKLLKDEEERQKVKGKCYPQSFTSLSAWSILLKSVKHHRVVTLKLFAYS